MTTRDFKQDYKLIVESYDKFKNLKYNNVYFKTMSRIINIFHG